MDEEDKDTSTMDTDRQTQVLPAQGDILSYTGVLASCYLCVWGGVCWGLVFSEEMHMFKGEN